MLLRSTTLDNIKPGAGRLELAQIFREHGEAYRRAHRLCAQQRRVMQAIEDCRTAALGGHLEACDRCGAEIARYHSCRNRHCPKCQTLAKERWVEARTAELLPVPYFHLVFTLPHEINPLAQGNPKVIYGLLFQAASDTLQSFGRDPKWLGGEIGITMVLHTWGQNLSQHLHVHCVVSGGALAPDGRWIPAKRGFLFPVRALSVVFRGSTSRRSTGLRGGTARLRRGDHPARRAFGLPGVPRQAPGQGLGGLRQTPLRRSRAGARLPRALHPSDRHRQRAPPGLRERLSPLPLPGLCPWEQDQGDAPPGGGVHPSVSAPCAPQGLHADPALWPPRQSPSYRAPGRLPGRPRCATPRLPKQKPSRPSSLACSGPMPTAARTVAKDGCARSDPSRPLPRATGPPLFRWAD